MTPNFVADTSAWHHAGATETIADRWEALVEEDEIALCAPVELELLYSARGPVDYLRLRADLDLLPAFPLDERCAERAARAQALLATRSQHRGPSPVDLLIAAIAEVNGATLLHYDNHFETIARFTGQPIEWLARPGSLP